MLPAESPAGSRNVDGFTARGRSRPPSGYDCLLARTGYRSNHGSKQRHSAGYTREAPWVSGEERSRGRAGSAKDGPTLRQACCEHERQVPPTQMPLPGMLTEWCQGQVEAAGASCERNSAPEASVARTLVARLLELNADCARRRAASVLVAGVAECLVAGQGGIAVGLEGVDRAQRLADLA